MTFDEEEKRILFICRDYYKTLDWALLNFLKSVDWSRPGQVQEAHRMLNEWAKMQPDEAIALLSPAIPDEVAHLHATRRIGELADDDLALYMIQLSQALIGETSHWTTLSQLLLERAVKNPYVVGHNFYWTLKS
mmetsp:Transcript_8102/g.4298  ORF Transcript_8102/g.4298 Transcript_8102/m.4298 type:complete len:134 (+) Transcript_8102:263-664(+)